MRNFYNNHKYSIRCPLQMWKTKDLLALVPENIKTKYSLDAYPECVLQELLLAQVGEIPDLFGNVEKYYAVDLTDASKIGRSDIQRVYEPYIREKQKEINKCKRKQAKKKLDQPKEKVLPVQKVIQQKLFEVEPEFSESDPTIYFAKIEYLKTVWCEDAKRYVYAKRPTSADAVIFGGVIYLGGWKPKNKKITSKGVQVIDAQPGSLYNAPKPYCDIINQHPELETRMAVQRKKKRDANEKKEILL